MASIVLVMAPGDPMGTLSSARHQARFTQEERAFVVSVARRYMRDAVRAEDVAQDAMLLAFQHRDAFRGDARFTTWLYRITATTAQLHLRRAQRRDAHSLSEETVQLDDRQGTPEEVSGAHEAVRLAGQHLAEMGAKYGEIFAMRFVDGYSETEIAERLHLEVATVKTRAHRARHYVRDRLERELARA